MQHKFRGRHSHVFWGGRHQEGKFNPVHEESLNATTSRKIIVFQSLGINPEKEVAKNDCHKGETIENTWSLDV